MLVRGTVARTAGTQLDRIGRHLRLAWPVFVVFLAQRLLTVAFVYPTPGGLLSLVTRWDTGWYLRLAQDGYVYPNISPDGPVRASNLAYLPLFPWLMRQVADTGLLSLRRRRSRCPGLAACSRCGRSSPSGTTCTAARWVLRCPLCGAWRRPRSP
jgi:hypothetical protein